MRLSQIVVQISIAYIGSHRHPYLKETSMITLHTADTPNGHKIAIALHELDMPYTLKPVDLGKGEQHRPEFLALSPNNKIPVIVDDDTGQVVFESCAILLHLADNAGRLLSQVPAKRSETLQWLFLQTGSVGPMLGQLWWFRHGTPTRNPQALERYTREAHRLYGVIDRRLAQHPYLVGAAYSIADIAMFAWLRAHEELGVEIAAYPHVRAWLDTIDARPAVRRGLDLLHTA
jgi:GST-like protein